ncbi:VOC family protein [Paramicrobacterium fandaimingii]|uniref:VOC family protein n=1 Tax=Paramicrobacterium fandaimingii TaxID=2708079 RepID=UPI00141FA3E8|nr:VOC family protein [Microbacterium fandaimingii]
MDTGIRYSTTTLACPDPPALADFYAKLTGGEVTFVAERDSASMRSARGRLDFMWVPDYREPQWPEDSSLLHLDFFVTDLATSAEWAIRCGARQYDFQPNAGRCLVFADPAGHPFCLTTVDDLG